jgi:hypothetical protein
LRKDEKIGKTTFLKVLEEMKLEGLFQPKN